MTPIIMAAVGEQVLPVELRPVSVAHRGRCTHTAWSAPGHLPGKLLSSQV